MAEFKPRNFMLLPTFRTQTAAFRRCATPSAAREVFEFFAREQQTCPVCGGSGQTWGTVESFAKTNDHK